jgi:hypothetical protein
MGNGGLLMFLTIGGFAGWMWWEVRRKTGVNKRNIRIKQRELRYQDKQDEIYRQASQGRRPERPSQRREPAGATGNRIALTHVWAALLRGARAPQLNLATVTRVGVP